MISQLPKDLITQLSTLTTLKKVGVWNNQLAWILAGKMELFGCPAAFFAFKSANITQLGNGSQLYENLEFDVHILDWQLDSTDGNFDQNLTVFDLSEAIYQVLQKYQPGSTADPGGSIIRIGETQDHEHAGVYHFIQSYKMTLVDNSMAEPVGGVPMNDMPLEIDATIPGSTDPNQPYKFNFPAP